MFDSEGDAMSLASRNTSVVIPQGMSMQEYYARLQNGHTTTINSGQHRIRRNSGSSVMSDTERMYGWSGSAGGVRSAEHQRPKYRVGPDGQLMLAEEKQQPQDSAIKGNPQTTPARPVVKSTRSENNGKPMYRPAFAPSADLPSSEEDEDDRPIQHDLPSTRPLKGRTSIRQKLGSVLARVGSVRRAGSTPPAGAASLGTSPREGEDYLSTPQARRPGLNRRGTSSASRSNSARSPSGGVMVTATDPKPDTTTEEDGKLTPTGETRANPVPTLHFTDEDADEEAAYKQAQESLARENGFSGLVRKLSRSATTGGSAAAAAARARQRALEAEKEAEAARLRDIKSKQEAEEYIRSMADIPLYKPPRSANVQNAKPLSSFAPRAALRTTPDNSLANAPRYSYYQRPVKDDDGLRRTQTSVTPISKQSNSTNSGASKSTSNNNSSNSGMQAAAGRARERAANRKRSGSTPSTYSSSSAYNRAGGVVDTIDELPPLPSIPAHYPGSKNNNNNDLGTSDKENWEIFKSESSNSLAEKARV